MKLRNKKTGKIFIADKEPVELFYRLDEGDELIRKTYVSISELNKEWEDYEPKEPLIKDEKIRKAIRAWASMNDIRYIEPCARSHKENYRIVGFNALHRSFTMEISNEYECRITMGQALSRSKRGAYTVDELCGEKK